MGSDQVVKADPYVLTGELTLLREDIAQEDAAVTQKVGASLTSSLMPGNHESATFCCL